MEGQGWQALFCLGDFRNGLGPFPVPIQCVTRRFANVLDKAGGGESGLDRVTVSNRALFAQKDSWICVHICTRAGCVIE